MTTDEKLIYMANQIDAFFAAQGAPRAIAGIADHIEKFWTREMRRELVALAAKNRSELKPYVRDAIKRIASALEQSPGGA